MTTPLKHLDELIKFTQAFHSFRYVKEFTQFTKYSTKEEQLQRDKEERIKRDKKIELWEGELTMVLDSMQSVKYNYYKQLQKGIEALKDLKPQEKYTTTLVKAHNKNIHATLERIAQLEKQSKKDIFIQAQLKLLKKKFPVIDAGVEEKSGIPKFVIVTNLIDETYIKNAFKHAGIITASILREVESAFILMEKGLSNSVELSHSQQEKGSTRDFKPEATKRLDYLNKETYFFSDKINAFRLIELALLTDDFLNDKGKWIAGKDKLCAFIYFLLQKKYIKSTLPAFKERPLLLRYRRYFQIRYNIDISKAFQNNRFKVSSLPNYWPDFQFIFPPECSEN